MISLHITGFIVDRLHIALLIPKLQCNIMCHNHTIIMKTTHCDYAYDTIREKSLMWTRKPSIPLNLAHVGRN